MTVLADLAALLMRHPLSTGGGVGPLRRFVRWQIGSRILGLPAVIPFVDSSRLVIARGMTGATGNIYVGLMEFEDMSFLLHYLRPGDLFGDIGANVGVYTVLAGAVRQARVVAAEPVPQTVERLIDNVKINGLEGRAHIHAVGVSDKPGRLRFSNDRDAMNRVVGDAEAGVDVPVTTLDDLFEGETPRMLKIDVEGYEQAVLRGARRVLADPGLHVVLIEDNTNRERYGVGERAVHQQLLDHGFAPTAYDPRTRTLTVLDGPGAANTIYLRDVADALERARSGPVFEVLNQRF